MKRSGDDSFTTDWSPVAELSFYTPLSACASQKLGLVPSAATNLLWWNWAVEMF